MNKTCDLCNKTFTTAYGLKKHKLIKIPCILNIASIENKFKCVECNHTFTSNQSLKKHMLKTCYIIKKKNTYINNTDEIDKIKKELDELKKQINNKKVLIPIICNQVVDNLIYLNKIDIIKNEYIYLLYLREFINSNQYIYKIGKTKQIDNKRFKQYPKGTIMLYQGICLNCDKMEKELIILFKTKYEHCKAIGNEYFKGNYKFMINDINTYIYNTENNIENNIENNTIKDTENNTIKDTENNTIKDTENNTIKYTENNTIKKILKLSKNFL